MVRVDLLQVWPNAWGPYRLGSSHLTADTLEELHAFAARLGLRRAWFQDHAIMPHYDLTAEKRVLAVAMGAAEVSMRAQLRARRALR